MMIYSVERGADGEELRALEKAAAVCSKRASAFRVLLPSY